MMNWWLKIILKINNQLFNKQNLNHQIVLIGNEIIGWNLTKDGIVKIVKKISTNRNIKEIKKVLRQDNNFSTRPPLVKKTRQIWMNMVNNTYNSTDDMINNLQELKGKTKLKFYKKISNYYNNVDFKMDEDTFARNAQGISKIHREMLLLMKFLQTKHQIKNMNIKYYDLYYTVIKKKM